jgi:hypothetical protein
VCTTVTPVGGWGSDYFRSLMQMVTQPNSVYICIGGWIGATTLYAATLPAQPMVWSFEADPVAFAEVRHSLSVFLAKPCVVLICDGNGALFHQLNENVKLNPTLSARIHVSNLCVHSRTGPQVLGAMWLAPRCVVNCAMLAR